MKRFIIFILFLFTTPLLADESECFVEFYPVIYKLHFNSAPDFKHSIKSTTCGQDSIIGILKHMDGMHGKISAKTIKHHFQLESGKLINLQPSTIEINTLISLIEKTFIKNKEISINNLRFLGTQSSLGIDKDEVVKIEGQLDLGNFSDQNITVVINNIMTNDQKRLWANIKLQKSIKLLFAKKDIGPGDDLSNAFEMKAIETDNPTEYAGITLEDLKYYQLNKIVTKGSALKKFDVMARSLVLAGEKTKVILIQKNLKLEVQATSLSSGRLGDTVTLRRNNNFTNTITGKVADFNEVRVEL